jgi:hypothetical protein
MAITRIGYCTHRTGKGSVRTMGDYCQHVATMVATDPSGEREVCTRHAAVYVAFGPQRAK